MTNTNNKMVCCPKCGVVTILSDDYNDIDINCKVCGFLFLLEDCEIFFNF